MKQSDEVNYNPDDSSNPDDNESKNNGRTSVIIYKTGSSKPDNAELY